MILVAKILTGIVALEHLYIMYFEMFAWETIGKRVIGTFPKELFLATKPLGANQGLYNGFLAAGLIWSFFISNEEWSYNIALFFLICVTVAGTYGAYTVNGRIFFTQAIPAICAIIALLLQKYIS